MLPWAFDSFQGAVRWSGCFGLRRAPRSSSRVPLPVGWPPRGSPSGRWRCRCLFSGPRGGRCPGGGDALGWPLPVGWPPRGSPSGRWPVPLPVGWPPRGSPSGRWRCRCLLGGPRGGRRADGGGRARVPFGGGAASLAPVGLRRAPMGPQWAAWCRAVAPVGLRRAPMGPHCGADASKPRAGPARRAPEGGWSVGPVGRLAAPPRGVGLSVLGGPDPALPKRRGGGSWGCAAGGVVSPRRGGGAGCLRASAPPRGVGLTSAPGGVVGRLGQAPSGPVGCRASSFRGRASACIAGVIPLAWKSSGLLRRGGAVWLASAPPVPKRLWCVCGSASAPPVPKRLWCVCGSPSVGCPRPRGGLGCPVRLVCRRPSGPRAFWTPALPKLRRADTVCRCSVGPEGLAESPLCRSAAGPTLPAHRGGLGPGPAEAVPGCVLGCPRTRRR